MTQPRRTKSFTSRGAAGPIELILDSDVPYYAIPAIPATQFGPFMRVQTSIQEAVAPFSDRENPPTPQQAEEAISKVVNLSLDGLAMVLDDESLARMTERVSDRMNPVDVTTLSQMFAYLASIYSGGEGDEKTDDANPSSDGADASDGSLALTGGSSEGASSSETSLSTTEPVAPAAVAAAPVIPATATEAPQTVPEPVAETTPEPAQAVTPEPAPAVSPETPTPQPA